jgi:hypothetical protein
MVVVTLVAVRTTVVVVVSLSDALYTLLCVVLGAGSGTVNGATPSAGSQIVALRTSTGGYDTRNAEASTDAAVRGLGSVLKSDTSSVLLLLLLQLARVVTTS